MNNFKPKSEVIDEALIKLTKTDKSVPIGTYTKISGQFWVSREFVRLRANKLGIKLKAKDS